MGVMYCNLITYFGPSLLPKALSHGVNAINIPNSYAVCRLKVLLHNNLDHAPTGFTWPRGQTEWPMRQKVEVRTSASAGVLFGFN